MSERRDMMRPNPIFIFSIARSGSTLLQRVLGTYEEIATVSEPWVLIPQVYALRSTGIASEYSHRLVPPAIEDFALTMDGQMDEYWREVRKFTLNLYEKSAQQGAAPPRYFLDKTPPYFFIVDEIMRIFPEGKFIFLWRNPLSIVASLIEWNDERWDPAANKQNLFDGIASLTRAYAANSGCSISVRFEDLVSGQQEPWERIGRYLDVDFDPQSLSAFSQVSLEGRKGDPTGVDRYQRLSQEPLTKWTTRINNPLRQAWAQRYLEWIGAERLELMGYDLPQLRRAIEGVPPTSDRLAGDCARVVRSGLKEPLRLRARRSVGLDWPSAMRYVLS